MGCAPSPSGPVLRVAKGEETAEGNRDGGGPFLGGAAGLSLLPKANHHGGSLLPAVPCQEGREITHLVHAPVVPVLLTSRREPPGPGGCKETRGGVRWG